MNSRCINGKTDNCLTWWSLNIKTWTGNIFIKQKEDSMCHVVKNKTIIHKSKNKTWTLHDFTGKNILEFHK